jgi:Ca-activated chloride channel family protein
MSDGLHALLTALAADWGAFDTTGLTFWQRDVARLAAVAFAATVVLLLVGRTSLRRRRDQGRVVLPAVLRTMRPAHTAWVRDVPALLLAAGIPCALLALADPHASLVASEATYPGRRIALMIDGSDSMRSEFLAPSLNAGTQQTFFTAIAAASRFVDVRREGKYRDLMALIEFGNRSYVITPFTNDYDNLRLSLALIGDPVEFSQFPDPATVIGSAVDQSLAVFKAFDFLEASGNLMVIFTDGEDNNPRVDGRPIADLVKPAIEHNIPIHFVRINFNKGYNEGIDDGMWKATVENAGGRFYIARDEASLLNAIAEIDRESAGTVQFRHYAAQQPRFSGFALAAAALWTLAAALRFVWPACSTVP